ncbi:aldolase [Ornithinimicrobium tianjinense]|uniref:3-oxo-tetronate 4-phosphate decarboxylase n=1 Tax=Ornithinimicrobium tianjinense TaxID=1195761 RepID=A0A917BFM5_9MICO|nr:aldolase [Ornithinimicrobium tianjinense]GGF41790.1 aldolase [Ornithinimicrobium tianjinense]
MHETEARQQIVDLAASLFQRGFSVGTAGNISVRLSSGYLMTPTNSSLGRLDADRLSLLDADWQHVGGDRPSKEVVMHRAMYDARPGARAIVHLHSPHVTALSCLRTGDGPLIPPLTPYFVMRLGREVPLVRYYRPGDPQMEAEIREQGRRGAALILSNHGSLVAGDSLEGAVNAAEELEVTAQLALLLEGRAVRPLSEDEVAELL